MSIKMGARVVVLAAGDPNRVVGGTCEVYGDHYVSYHGENWFAELASLLTAASR
jgi:hypothetical protein